MATPADLDRIARALPGVSVGKYWDDPAVHAATDQQIQTH